MLSKAKAQFILRERRARAAVNSFDSLIDTPHNLASPLVLPANAKLYAALAAPAAGAKIEAVTYSFNALDSAKWDSFLTNGTITAADGELDLTTDGSVGSSAYYNIKNAQDLRDSEAYVELVRPLLCAVNADGARSVFRVFDTANGGDAVEWFVATNHDLAARVVNDGAPTETFVVGDWSSSDHAWLKISLNGAGTTATWWTAPDSGNGTPGVWTARHTSSTLPSTFASAKVTLFVEYWGSGPGAITQTARFDNLNIGEPVLLCSVNGANRYIRSADAGEIVPLGYFEKGATLTAVYNVSTINLYLGAPLGERLLIATKTV